MYRPYSRSGTLLKGLAGAGVAASWPGMLALPLAFTVPALAFIPLMCFAIAFAHGLVLGLPLYLFLERRGWANGWLAAVAGACIGTVPVLIFAASTYSPVSTDLYSVGWLSQVKGALGMFGFLGLCGGVTFFVIVSGSEAAEE